MKVFNRIGSQLPFTRAGITVHIIYFLPNKCIVPAVFSIKGSFPNFVTIFYPCETVSNNFQPVFFVSCIDIIYFLLNILKRRSSASLSGMEMSFCSSPKIFILFSTLLYAFQLATLLPFGLPYLIKFIQ